MKIGLLCLLLCTSCVQKQQPIGIMSAMKEEIDFILSKLDDPKQVKRGANFYYTGTINNKNVVLVSGGIGTVNAAMTATTLIESFNIKVLIYTGVGLGITNTNHLTIDDIVIGTNFINANVDHTEWDLPLGHLSREDVGSYDADQSLVTAALAQSPLKPNQKIVKGRIVTLDNFINYFTAGDFLAGYTDSVLVDMESASVAQIAYKYQLPILVVRTINNTYGAKKGDYGNKCIYTE
ncbi:MAG: 5'-methylthioadenosine/S-adenosylhomocysteine nucleosidase [Brevinema sp.]